MLSLVLIFDHSGHNDNGDRNWHYPGAVSSWPTKYDFSTYCQSHRRLENIAQGLPVPSSLSPYWSNRLRLFWWPHTRLEHNLRRTQGDENILVFFACNLICQIQSCHESENSLLLCMLLVRSSNLTRCSLYLPSAPSLPTRPLYMSLSPPAWLQRPRPLTPPPSPSASTSSCHHLSAHRFPNLCTCFITNMSYVIIMTCLL
jgi:hypothetical protein